MIDDKPTEELTNTDNPTDDSSTDIITPVIDKQSKFRKRISNTARDATILSLAAKNISPHKISKIVDLDHEQVSVIINKFKPVFKELDNIQDYRKIKTDLLSAAQLTFLRTALSDSKVRQMGSYKCIQAFNALNNAERLERNLSTANVGSAAPTIGSISINNLLQTNCGPNSTNVKNEEKDDIPTS